MNANGEFIVAPSDVLKARAVQEGKKIFEEVGQTVDGVPVRDAMGDVKGTGVLVSSDSTEAIGGPLALTLDGKDAVGLLCNGLGAINDLPRKNLAPADGRLVPVAPEIEATDSATLTSATEGGWRLAGEIDCFDATDASIDVGSIALPADPSGAEGATVDGEWTLHPSVGSVVPTESGVQGSVTVVFTPADTDRFAPVTVKVPVEVTDNRTVGVSPVETAEELANLNRNGITLEIPVSDMTLGDTWESGTVSVSSNVVTQTVKCTAGTAKELPEATIKDVLGYTDLTGSHAVVPVLVRIPAGVDTLQIVDTTTGGIGMANDQTLKLTGQNVLNGSVLHLLTPISSTTKTGVKRTLTFKVGATDVLQHVLTIDASGLTF